ncbi:MAG: TonB family protein [Povalibacter sp.]
MNTAELQTPIRPQLAVRVPKAAMPAPATRGVPVVVLSTDQALAQAIQTAAGQDHAVMVAATLEEAIALASHGECAILVTDQALSQAALGRLSTQMHVHDPATITIAVGTKGDDHALIGLLSSAVVERFMLKPVTPSLARLVLRSAAAEYRSHQSRTRNETMLREATPSETPPQEPHASAPRESIITAVTRVRPPKPQLTQVTPTPAITPDPIVIPEPMRAPVTVSQIRNGNPAMWMWVAVAIAAIAALGWWSAYSPRPGVDLSRIVETNLKSAQLAMNAGHDVEPADISALHYFTTVLALDPANTTAAEGMHAIAVRMTENVKGLIVEGRLAEAGIALERLRRISNDERRLAILDSELRRVQTHQLELLSAPPPVAAAEQPAQRKPEPVRMSSTAKAADVQMHSSTTPANNSRAESSASAPTITAEPVPESRPPISTEPTPITEEPALADVSLNTSLAESAPAQVPVAPAPESIEQPLAPADPKLVKVVQPEYPDEARMRGMNGWVDLTLSVDKSGAVADAKVNASSKRMFERPALAAVRKWQYTPLTLAADDARQTMRVKVEFRLE